jgi:hypothetical protein
MEQGKHHNYKVQQAYDTYGIPAQLILADVPVYELNAAEAYFVRIHRADQEPYGLNLTRGGGSRDGGRMFDWVPATSGETTYTTDEVVKDNSFRDFLIGVAFYAILLWLVLTFILPFIFR